VTEIATLTTTAERSKFKRSTEMSTEGDNKIIGARSVFRQAVFSSTAAKQALQFAA
jgi:hypothetical protein